MFDATGTRLWVSGVAATAPVTCLDGAQLASTGQSEPTATAAAADATDEKKSSAVFSAYVVSGTLDLAVNTLNAVISTP